MGVVDLEAVPMRRQAVLRAVALALAAWRNDSYALRLSACHMPNLDGGYWEQHTPLIRSGNHRCPA